MQTISLLFSTSRHPMSTVIRVCTWSSWSHFALIGGNEVIEATVPAGTHELSGQSWSTSV